MYFREEFHVWQLEFGEDGSGEEMHISGCLYNLVKRFLSLVNSLLELEIVVERLKLSMRR